MKEGKENITRGEGEENREWKRQRVSCVQGNK